MARDQTLPEDLAALAAEQRARLGELPSAEQLVAYRDGELPEEEAERVRDRLAADPELADLYLELKRLAELEILSAAAAGDDAEAVDAAWRELKTKIDVSESSAATSTASVTPETAPHRRRVSNRALLALAAVLLLGLGVSWMLGGRGRPEPVPGGEYYAVEVTGTLQRDARLPVPRGAPGVELRIDLPAIRSPPGAAIPEVVVVELLDAAGREVRREEFTEQSEIRFRVAADELKEGRSYQLLVRPAGAHRGEPTLVDQVFAPVFID